MRDIVRKGDASNDVVVGERMQTFTAVRVPKLAANGEHRRRWGTMTHAVKSALPEAARALSRDNLALHTAPLWPRKVPIQSPVHSLSIGLPSLQLEMSRKVPSSWMGENERCVIGRVWPGATSGVDFKWLVMGNRRAARCGRGQKQGSPAKYGHLHDNAKFRRALSFF